MTTLVVGKHWFGKIVVDDWNELGLGPGDWVMLGVKNTAGCVNGRFAVIDNPRAIRSARRSKSRRTK